MKNTTTIFVSPKQSRDGFHLSYWQVFKVLIIFSNGEGTGKMQFKVWWNYKFTQPFWRQFGHTYRTFKCTFELTVFILSVMKKFSHMYTNFVYTTVGWTILLAKNTEKHLNVCSRVQ